MVSTSTRCHHNPRKTRCMHVHVCMHTRKTGVNHAANRRNQTIRGRGLTNSSFSAGLPGVPRLRFWCPWDGRALDTSAAASAEEEATAEVAGNAADSAVKEPAAAEVACGAADPAAAASAEEEAAAAEAACGAGSAADIGGGATKLVPRGQVGVEPALIRDVGSALDGRKGRQKRGPRAERPRRHTRQRQGTCRSWGATKARLWPRARGQRMGLAADSVEPPGAQCGGTSGRIPGGCGSGEGVG